MIYFMRMLREVKLLCHMDHENVLAIRDIIPPPQWELFNDVYIAYELMETNLHQIIHSNQPLSEEHIQGLEMMINALRMTSMHGKSLYGQDLIYYSGMKMACLVHQPLTKLLEYRIVFIDSADALFMEKNWNLANGHAVHDIQHPCRADVAVRRELRTPASDRSCIHLEFEISGIGLVYETGDHVGVFSENCIETVEEAERRLASSDTYFSIHANDGDGSPCSGGSLAPPFRSPCTLRTALAR